MNKKVAVVSLGCDKNRVDSEEMLFRLTQAGYGVTADFSVAEIIIVNTCAFIASARAEAIDTVLEMVRYKTEGACEKLLVTGCLPQKHGAELVPGLPEVDAFLGVADYERLPDILVGLYAQDGKVDKLCVCGGDDMREPARRLLTTPAHYAYLKIADGCDNHCTFCTIPSIRGAYRSRSIRSLAEEARGLADSGVRELILVAQDVTRYGTDLYGKQSLVALLKELAKTDVQWIRLLYCYPELVDDALLDCIAEGDKICKYIDIPIQHVDDGILKLMNRRSTYAGLCALMEKIRNAPVPIAVRTTVMAGFPSETDEQFGALYRFLDTYKPEHTGVFAYSREENTPAYKLKGQLSKAIKAERVRLLGELNLKNRMLLNGKALGKTVRVLYEDIDYDKKMFVGRTQYDAPDIDSRIYFTSDFADVGNFYDVRVTGFRQYDLIGEKA